MASGAMKSVMVSQKLGHGPEGLYVRVPLMAVLSSVWSWKFRSSMISVGSSSLVAQRIVSLWMMAIDDYSVFVGAVPVCHGLAVGH